MANRADPTEKTTDHGELVYTVLEGIKRGQMGQYSGRLLLERCLPETRPTPVVLLPIIDTARGTPFRGGPALDGGGQEDIGAIKPTGWGDGAGVHPPQGWHIRQQARLEEP